MIQLKPALTENKGQLLWKLILQCCQFKAEVFNALGIVQNQNANIQAKHNWWINRKADEHRRSEDGQHKRVHTMLWQKIVTAPKHLPGKSEVDPGEV